jgi:hypothetical protein
MDTVTILRDLQAAYPTPNTAIHSGVHQLLGEMNEAFTAGAYTRSPFGST